MAGSALFFARPHFLTPYRIHFAERTLGHGADPKGHVSEKWTRFSTFHDAPFLEVSIGSIPKVQVHVWVRCSKPARRAVPVRRRLR
jgi:hypothetical protein